MSRHWLSAGFRTYFRRFSSYLKVFGQEAPASDRSGLQERNEPCLLRDESLFSKESGFRSLHTGFGLRRGHLNDSNIVGSLAGE